MKNNILLLFTFIIFGCIEDKGNYEYNPVRDLEIKNLTSITLSVGETVTLIPKVIIRYDKTETALENVEYEWLVEHEVVGREPSLVYTGKEYGSYDCMLRIIDPLTKVVSYMDFEISVISKYNSGILILSEENGQAQLSMIRSKYMQDTIIYDGEWKNVYSIENDGDKLRGKPIFMQEHWVYSDGGEISLGEITVLTEENGKILVQELNGNTLKRETYIEQEFKDGKVPLNFAPKSVLHTDFDSFILDKSGEVYIRRSSVNTAYHTGYFADNIKLWGGKNFSDLIFTQYNMVNGVLALEINEKGKRDYVGIYSDYWRQESNLKRLNIIGGYYNNHFKDLDDEILWCDWRALDDYYTSGMSIVTITQSGDYILHCFDMDQADRRSGKWNVLNSKKINLTKEKGIANLKGMCTNKKMNYTYYWDDYTIYALENWYNTDFFEVKKFDKKIVAVSDYSVWDRIWKKRLSALIIGFEDGSVEIWEIERGDAAKLKNKVYTSKNCFGNIKNIISKVGYCFDFFNH